jgi:hypothetical protein
MAAKWKHSMIELSHSAVCLLFNCELVKTNEGSDAQASKEGLFMHKILQNNLKEA